MGDCLFCGIAKGGIPADVVYSDERVMAFRDINPQAPVHILVIPRAHYDSLDAMSDAQLLSDMLQTAARLAREMGIAESGYRVVMNCNADGGQTVQHIHAHLLGGRAMAWPPG
ncbi:MAG: histidine triad nucleotide-binding protein [Spirochaetota bacterium]|nr:histidine triad nucleotide-binding protein [Spirochaetota bacterium]